jgi:hypothetical protein
MGKGVWYEQFEQCRDEIARKREGYETRCKELGMKPRQIQEEVQKDLITRIVRESNWQEQYYLTVAATRELAEAVFNDPSSIQGPHLDMNRVVSDHREQVIKLKKARKTPEEIAAFNLSRAHVAVDWIYREMLLRQGTVLDKVLRAGKEWLEKEGENLATGENLQAINEGIEAMLQFAKSSRPLYGPLIGTARTLSDVFSELPGIQDPKQLLGPAWIMNPFSTLAPLILYEQTCRDT